MTDVAMRGRPSAPAIQPVNFNWIGLALVGSTDIQADNPDTVRCPAISYFVDGERFAELDKTVTDTRPALVVEIASSSDRRRGLDQRLQSYFDWGVPLIWVIDTHSRQVHLFETGKRPRLLADYQTLFGSAALPGFTMLVGNLFADPKWWTG